MRWNYKSRYRCSIENKLENEKLGETWGNSIDRSIERVVLNLYGPYSPDMGTLGYVQLQATFSDF